MRKKTIVICSLLLSAISQVVVAKTFYCHVDAIGYDDSNKTYFVYIPDSLAHDLTYKEYVRSLKIFLCDNGYTESNEENADLKIAFDYMLSDRETQQSIGSVNNFVYTNGKLVPNGTSNYTTHTTYQNFSLSLKASDNRTNEAKWSVIVTDRSFASEFENMRRLMPFYLYSAVAFVGTDTHGTREFKIKSKDPNVKKYNFTWKE